jgi:2-polyprenyl-6-methoxyphenol hydroxylase-like FAD-dependent oxidoreductase
MVQEKLAYSRISSTHGTIFPSTSFTSALVIVIARICKPSEARSVSEDEQVHSAIGYSTRYYQFPADAQHEWSSALKPFSQSDGAAFSLLENHTCAVIIGNIGGQYPPTEAAAFEQRLAVALGTYLPTLLQDAQPLDDPRGYRIPVCVRHHFEQMEDWPHGLLVMGDALCNFDPIYGQGMSVAAIEAETLARCLHEQQSYSQPGFERHVLGRMQEVIAPAWWLVVSLISIRLE